MDRELRDELEQLIDRGAAEFVADGRLEAR
jgi:hypothetical protein